LASRTPEKLDVSEPPHSTNLEYERPLTITKFSPPASTVPSSSTKQNVLASLNGKLDHLLDPMSYFSSLESLELKVASIFKFDEFEDMNDIKCLKREGFQELNDCIFNMGQVLEAFNLLEAEEFCKGEFYLFVQDWDRLETEKIPVMRTVPIQRQHLSDIAQMAREVQSTTLANREDCSILIPILRRTMDTLKGMGFQINYGKFTIVLWGECTCPTT